MAHGLGQPRGGRGGGGGGARGGAPRGGGGGPRGGGPRGGGPRGGGVPRGAPRGAGMPRPVHGRAPGGRGGPGVPAPRLPRAPGIRPAGGGGFAPRHAGGGGWGGGGGHHHTWRHRRGRRPWGWWGYPGYYDYYPYREYYYIETQSYCERLGRELALYGSMRAIMAVLADPSSYFHRSVLSYGQSDPWAFAWCVAAEAARYVTLDAYEQEIIARTLYQPVAMSGYGACCPMPCR